MLFNAIVIPDDPVRSVEYAAKELAYHLKMATARTLPVIPEAQANAGEKYFYLGDCKYNAGLKGPSMPWNTGVIKVNKDSIQFAGLDGDKKNFYDTNSCGTLFAVYDFLEKYLKVRWIWPGKDGEVIPKYRALSVKEGVTTVNPVLLSSDFRSYPDRRYGTKGWSSKKAMERYFKNTQIWLLRHRFAKNRSVQGGHAFRDYYQRYFKTNPGFFSMMPYGKREPSFDHRGRRTFYMSFCVTSPEFVKKVVDNWSKNPSKLLNLNENDTAGECTCDSCLTADNSPLSNAERRAAALKQYKQKVKLWPYALGSISNRYCHFWLAAQKEADKINPNHLISGLIYANYSEPPTDKIKLNNRMHLRFCPPVMYPFTKEKISDYKRIWSGWAKTGASLQFRPNFALCGNCFPIQYHREFYEMFTYAYKNNMASSDVCAHVGQNAVQGLVDYVIVSLNHRPDAPLAQLEDEFYSFFGAAKEPVRKYFEYLTHLTMEQGFPNNSLSENDLEGGVKLARYMVYVADSLFTPEVMAKCFKMVDDAAKTPGLDKISARRVQMLRYGLTQMELSMKVQREYRKHLKGASLDGFYAAYAELTKFRRSIEKYNLTNMTKLYYFDNLAWHKKIREANLKK